MPIIYRIGSAARRAGVSRETIRNYERRGLIVIPRDSTGDRFFTEKEVNRIREVYDVLRQGRHRENQQRGSSD